MRVLHVSRDGSLWTGSSRGLSRWDGQDGFQHFVTFDSDNKRNSGVRSIEEDPHGNLWIGTQSQGIIRLNSKTGEIVPFSAQGDRVIGDRSVLSLMIDDRGLVWAGTQRHGIALIDHNGKVRELSHDPEDPTSLSSNRVTKIFQDNRNQVWVGTDRGLNLWLPEQRSFRKYRYDVANPTSLSEDLIYDIVQDRGDVIWIGTFNGISMWNPEIRTFTHIKREQEAVNTLSDNRVSSFAEADDGRLWIGTLGGLNLWDIKNNRFEHIRAREDGTGLVDNTVMSLMLDRNERLWAGTMRRGLSRYDTRTGEFTNFAFDKGDLYSLSSNSVSSIHEDAKGRIWVATYGGGLNLYREDGTFQRFPRSIQPTRDFPSYFLVDIEEGLDGKLWLASDGGGVIRFDPETEAVEAMRFNANSPYSISENNVICLLQTEDALWAGTRDTGLNRYADGRWEHFNYEDGLPSGMIYGLLEDEDKKIWISHGKGMSSLDPDTGQFTNYDTSHGLQGNDFNSHAYLKTSDGKMLFGGANGFNAFYPEQIRINDHKPPVKLTRFSKLNRDIPLDKPAYELEAIELSYDDYVVGFEFSALDFTNPSRNQYRYMLAGFDREWVSANKIRQATYTNLGPGDYTFRVQGSNNDGVWNEQGLAIDLTVSPAPWATWWAMALYTLVAIAVVYGTAQAYSVRLHREEQRRYSEQLEALVAERTSALENEITGHKTAQQELSRSLQEKEVLLKEVHHRVKNNMQVISSLLNIQADSVMDERFQTLLTESQQRIKSMALIHENLYRSDNLLEINFHEYIQMLTNGLVRFYRFDNIIIGLSLEVDNIFLDIDTAVPCGLIINELVSNSLKHGFKGRTGEGHIVVQFAESQGGTHYKFLVSDDGNGIAEDIDIENATSMGLEIVRILTEQLDGEWSYRSNGGAEFTVEFPRKK